MFYVSARRQPFPQAAAFDRWFEGAFDRVFSAPADAEAQPARHPFLDVAEDDRQFVLVLDVPGVRREDIDVSVEGRRVSISARSPAQAAPQGSSGDTEAGQAPAAEAAPARPARALLRERSPARYARSVTLPVEVDQAGAQARLENGVLTLTLPKRAASVARLTVN